MTTTSEHPDWQSVADHPAWRPYRDRVQALPSQHVPSAEDLQSLLPSSAQLHSGRHGRFVPASELAPERASERASEQASERASEPKATPDTAARSYEEEIFATGRVSTRENNLHDLCNALVWSRFPLTKAALNARHLCAPRPAKPGQRGRLRDALTLFDECGAVLSSPDRGRLEAVARHDWAAVFGAQGEAWPETLQLTVFGHGTLEMFWQPYKAITVRCLLLELPEPRSAGKDADYERLDLHLARCWGPGGMLNAPAQLCPLPLMGIPGWWPGDQDTAFYADSGVFRRPAPDRVSPPVFSWPA